MFSHKLNKPYRLSLLHCLYHSYLTCSTLDSTEECLSYRMHNEPIYLLLQAQQTLSFSFLNFTIPTWPSVFLKSVQRNVWVTENTTNLNLSLPTSSTNSTLLFSQSHHIYLTFRAALPDCRTWSLHVFKFPTLNCLHHPNNRLCL